MPSASVYEKKSYQLNFAKKKEIELAIIRLWPILNDEIRDLLSIRYGIPSPEIRKMICSLNRRHIIKYEDKRIQTWYGAVSGGMKLRNISKLSEDTIWEELLKDRALKPFFEKLKKERNNVFRIIRYGFTEMLNNIIDHSKADKAVIFITASRAAVRATLIDDGIGVFENIKQVYGFEDMEQVLLELSKGKLTTDPKRHSGEGIFFTSKLFGEFVIQSTNASFIYSDVIKQSHLGKVENKVKKGTQVDMIVLNEGNEMEMETVFNRFTSEDEYGFDKTIVEMMRCTSDGDLVSRSQAKRALARLDKFKAVTLDFEGVKIMEQGFGDELFRVGLNSLEGVTFEVVNATEELKNMIRRVSRQETADRIKFQ